MAAKEGLSGSLQAVFWFGIICFFLMCSVCWKCSFSTLCICVYVLTGHMALADHNSGGGRRHGQTYVSVNSKTDMDITIRAGNYDGEVY